MSKLEIIHLEKKLLCGLSKTYNPVKENLAPELWDQFVKRVPEIACLSDREFFGVVRCSPQNKENMEFNYAPAAEVEPMTTDVPEGMELIQIPQGQYARYVYQGPISKICSAFQDIHGGLLQENGLRPREDFELELYDERFDAQNPENPESICEILIPVEEL